MNYGELQTQFTSILGRRDLTSTLRDTFLSLSISRIQRELRAPFMESTLDVTIGEDYDGLEIPSDYLALCFITVGSEPSKLQRVDLLTALNEAQAIGIPKVFARQGSKWILGPAPAEDEVITIGYFAEFTDLEDSEDESTLTIIAPDLIIYGALIYASEYFLDRRLEVFESRYRTILDMVQSQADFDELSYSKIMPCFSIEDEN
jgi:hypothetical protein